MRGTFALPALDLATMTFCFAAGGLVNFSYRNVTDERIFILILLSAAAVAAFKYLGHYERRRLFWQEVGDVAAVAAIGFLMDSALLYLVKINFSRLWVLTSWTGIAIALPLMRLAFKKTLLSFGSWRQPTVIIGTGATAREAARAYEQDKYLGYDVVAFLDPLSDIEEPKSIEVAGKRVPVLPLGAESRRHLALFGRPHVVAALDGDQLAAHEDLLEKLCFEHSGIDVISPLRGVPTGNARLTQFFSHEVLALRIHNNLARPWARFVKRLFDLAAASTLLVFLAPLMLTIAGLLALQGGPVFYRHRRIGRNGEPFDCLKFRTMVPNADRILADILARDPEARAEWERDQKLRNDPRITALGRFLRKWSLDELPQLINILRGEMSLVGPRPVVEEELERYGPNRIYYELVRPGLTGLWQTSGRNDIDYAERVALDTWYVRNWTLWNDIIILFKTLFVVPARAGAY